MAGSMPDAVTRNVSGGLRAQLASLTSQDDVLAVVMREIGEPVIRTRPKGLEGLVRIIIAQQLSVSSARAITGRLEDAIDIASPDAVLTAPDEVLAKAGLSRPKQRYLRAAAEAVASGALDLHGLAALPDEEAITALCKVKGVGPWTAAIYLLFCEARLKVWPPKDVALLFAYAHAAGLDEKLAMADFDAMAARTFTPLPGLAAHALWTYYGVVKNRPPV